jgi:moderate conductance mechanosensitive channel
MHIALTAFAAPPEAERLRDLVLDWRADLMTFLRHDVPKLLLVVVGSFVLLRLLRRITAEVSRFQAHRLPTGLRSQQIKTLAGVVNSIGTIVVVSVATMYVLSLLGLNLAPLLASAGIAGLAIGFGAQTLVKDFINGFFVLLEDQYNVGDTVRLAGFKGVVEDMTLRRTVLRDDDGTVHIVPNSELKIVSNMTRDWAQMPMRVVVAYDEPSDKIVDLLQGVGEELRHDAAFADDIVSDIQVPGIDRVGNGEAEYLMLVKTRPNKQYAVSRELRRRIKASFEKNQIRTAAPGRVYVRELAADSNA